MRQPRCPELWPEALQAEACGAARVSLLPIRLGPDSTQASTLASIFGLSAAEGRLAARIGRGEELKDIAEAEGIVIETARARLKAVFAKTGTHRQAELAILIAGLMR